MALKGLMLIVWLIMCCSTSLPSIDGRKLLINVQHSNNRNVPPSQPAGADSLYQAALPKGTVPPSTPSKKGHAATTDQKLIARHLAAIDRILRSVPSPGVGH